MLSKLSSQIKNPQFSQCLRCSHSTGLVTQALQQKSKYNPTKAIAYGTSKTPLNRKCISTLTVDL